MRNRWILLIFILTSIIFVSCNNKERKRKAIQSQVENSVKSFLKNKEEFSFYETLSFDSVEIKMHSSAPFDLSMEILAEELDVLMNGDNTKLDSLNKLIENYQDTIYGYKIGYKFKARTDSGTIDTLYMFFALDINFNVINYITANERDSLVELDWSGAFPRKECSLDSVELFPKFNSVITQEIYQDTSNTLACEDIGFYFKEIPKTSCNKILNTIILHSYFNPSDKRILTKRDSIKSISIGKKSIRVDPFNSCSDNTIYLLAIVYNGFDGKEAISFGCIYSLDFEKKQIKEFWCDSKYYIPTGNTSKLTLSYYDFCIDVNINN